MSEINVSKLHKELESAGIQFSGCSADGVVWGKKRDKKGCNVEIQDLPEVQAVIQAHDPSPDQQVILSEKYELAGITSQKMLFALWKKVMQSDSSEADSLQEKIDQVNLEAS
ncbi:MAG: hypothetical protein J7K66_02200 [Anaerolineaceae bacterium]|nr:hypothetical protein [Anaerolineaceae bacterium]